VYVILSIVAKTAVGVAGFAERSDNSRVDVNSPFVQRRPWGQQLRAKGPLFFFFTQIPETRGHGSTSVEEQTSWRSCGASFLERISAAFPSMIPAENVVNALRKRVVQNARGEAGAPTHEQYTARVVSRGNTCDLLLEYPTKRCCPL